MSTKVRFYLSHAITSNYKLHFGVKRRQDFVILRNVLTDVIT